VLVDQRLTGLILGMTLHTRPHEVLRALVEATAYGARRIIETVEAGGAPIDTVVAAGGLPSHAPWMMQAYADVLGRDIVVAQTSQGSALGAAIVAAVAAGEFESVQAAQDVLVHFRELVYHPEPSARAVYDDLYRNFVLVHDQFAATGALGSVMKDVLAIRDRTAKELTHA
jgi:L-ribulokinase